MLFISHGRRQPAPENERLGQHNYSSIRSPVCPPACAQAIPAPAEPPAQPAQRQQTQQQHKEESAAARAAGQPDGCVGDENQQTHQRVGSKCAIAQRCSPSSNRCQQQRHRGWGAQLDQRSNLNQKNHGQSKHTACSHTAVIHRLQPSRRAGREAIGRVHQAIVMQSPAEPDAAHHNQRTNGEGRPAEGSEQPPDRSLNQAQQSADPRREACNALKARLEPRPARKNGIKHPGTS